MALVPADSVELDALMALFNGAYSDYFVPLELDRAGLELTIDICDIDLGASRVDVEDDEPAAFAFLALSVIPSLKITDRGLVDVDRFELVPLEVA